MHSIERYGIVALLFLVVTIVAVLLWDGKEADPEIPGARPTTVERPAVTTAPPRERATPAAPAPDDRVVLTADARPGPLTLATARHREALEAPVEEPPVERLEEAPPATSPAGGNEASTPAPAARPRERTASPSVPAPAGRRTYVVKAGDTLGEIAQYQLGTSRRWKEIVAVNDGLDPNRLRVGQTILLPSADPGAPVTAVAREAAGPASSQGTAIPSGAPRSAPTYRVAAGDSLWRIAQRTLGDGNRWHEIADLNPRVDPDKLAAGVLLTLPASASAAAAPAPRSAPRRAETPPVVASNKDEKPSSRGRKVQ